MEQQINCAHKTSAETQNTHVWRASASDLSDYYFYQFVNEKAYSWFPSFFAYFYFYLHLHLHLPGSPSSPLRVVSFRTFRASIRLWPWTSFVLQVDSYLMPCLFACFCLCTSPFCFLHDDAHSPSVPPGWDQCPSPGDITNTCVPELEVLFACHDSMRFFFFLFSVLTSFYVQYLSLYIYISYIYIVLAFLLFLLFLSLFRVLLKKKDRYWVSNAESSGTASRVALDRAKDYGPRSVHARRAEGASVSKSVVDRWR